MTGRASDAAATGTTDRARARALARWFGRAARPLPWRRDRTAWGTLVSEAMLQQTQVARVVERYEAFLERFPTAATLAAADEQDVLAAWRGLGYYRRARHLHAAARRIVDEHGGRVPDSVEALRALPGVGRYTAGAVASLAFGRAAPIVDGNVQRVLARWHARRGDPTSRATVTWTWERAGALVATAADPGVLNEALMELGATVCTPAAPRCDACPVASSCAARRRGVQDRIPPPKPPAKRTSVHHHSVVIVRGGRVLVEQRPATGLWSRMWQAPTVEAARALRPAELRRRLDVPLAGLRRRERFEHRTTHRAVTFHVYEGTTRVRRGTWHPLDALDDLPLSNAQRRILAGPGAVAG